MPQQVLEDGHGDAELRIDAGDGLRDLQSDALVDVLERLHENFQRRPRASPQTAEAAGRFGANSRCAVVEGFEERSKKPLIVRRRIGVAACDNGFSGRSASGTTERRESPRSPCPDAS